MIRFVPGPRLIWFCAIVGVPLLTAVGLRPDWIGVIVPTIFAAMAIAFWDLRSGINISHGFKVTLPARSNLFLGRNGELEVRIQNSQKRQRSIRVGLNVPAEIKSEHEVMDVNLPADAETSILRWKCAGARRGSFAVSSTHVEIDSPGRLWTIRSAQPSEARIRVYPDLLTERKNVAAVFLRRGSFGARAQRQLGKGRDFEKLRDYVSGDPIEDVHWKASAKRGRLVAKVFQIERTQEVYVAVDCSRLSNRASSEKTPDISTLDRFVTTALLIGLATEQQKDHFGLITFSDQVHSLIRARNGKSHFGLCRDALFDLQPRLVTPDYDELFSTIRLRLRKRALILILTALDDPLLAESFAKSVQLVNRQHLIFVSMIEPGRVEPMFKTPVQSDAEIYDALAGQMIWQKLREVEKMLAWRGVRFSAISNESVAPRVVSQYLEVKQRQIL
jgi:uncharacterized protein (DUF58 family)